MSLLATCHCTFHVLDLQLLIRYLRTFVIFLVVAGFLFLLVVVLTLKRRISESNFRAWHGQVTLLFSHPAVRQTAMHVLMVTSSPCIITIHDVGSEVSDDKTGGCHVDVLRACRPSQMSPRRRFRGRSQKLDTKCFNFTLKPDKKVNHYNCFTR